jgi:hypothetical protein
VRVRLRPRYSPEDEAAIYAQTYDHTRWPEHVRRVAWTLDQLREAVNTSIFTWAVDIACGDGEILGSLDEIRHREYIDRTDGERVSIIGLAEDSHALVQQYRPWDLVIMTEILEHLDNPDSVLTSWSRNTRWLLTTTPLGETDPEYNAEHYWGWDQQGFEQMLQESGWEPFRHVLLEDEYYTYQLVIAMSRFTV